MQNDALRLIARLKAAAARSGFSVDVVRLVADTAYARDILTRFADQADEDNVLLALQVLDALGLAAAPAPARKVVPPPVGRAQSEAAAARDDDEQPKYVGSLRG